MWENKHKDTFLHISSEFSTIFGAPFIYLWCVSALNSGHCGISIVKEGLEMEIVTTALVGVIVALIAKWIWWVMYLYYCVFYKKNIYKSWPILRGGCVLDICTRLIDNMIVLYHFMGLYFFCPYLPEAPIYHRTNPKCANSENSSSKIIQYV